MPFLVCLRLSPSSRKPATGGTRTNQAALVHPTCCAWAWASSLCWAWQCMGPKSLQRWSQQNRWKERYQTWRRQTQDQMRSKCAPTQFSKNPWSSTGVKKSCQYIRIPGKSSWRTWRIKSVLLHFWMMRLGTLFEAAKSFVTFTKNKQPIFTCLQELSYPSELIGLSKPSDSIPSKLQSSLTSQRCPDMLATVQTQQRLFVTTSSRTACHGICFSASSWWQPLALCVAVLPFTSVEKMRRMKRRRRRVKKGGGHVQQTLMSALSA